MVVAAFARLDRHYQKDQPAGPGDGIPAGQCPQCGFTGRHPSPRGACINVLRHRIAMREFKRGKLSRAAPANTALWGVLSAGGWVTLANLKIG